MKFMQMGFSLKLKKIPKIGKAKLYKMLMHLRDNNENYELKPILRVVYVTVVYNKQQDADGNSIYVPYYWVHGILSFINCEINSDYIYEIVEKIINQIKSNVGKKADDLKPEKLLFEVINNVFNDK